MVVLDLGRARAVERRRTGRQAVRADHRRRPSRGASSQRHRALTRRPSGRAPPRAPSRPARRRQTAASRSPAPGSGRRRRPGARRGRGRRRRARPSRHGRRGTARRRDGGREPGRRGDGGEGGGAVGDEAGVDGVEPVRRALEDGERRRLRREVDAEAVPFERARAGGHGARACGNDSETELRQRQALAEAPDHDDLVREAEGRGERRSVPERCLVGLVGDDDEAVPRRDRDGVGDLLR